MCRFGVNIIFKTEGFLCLNIIFYRFIKFICIAIINIYLFICLFNLCKSRKNKPQKLTQLSSRSHPRHLVGKRTAQKDTIIDITINRQPGVTLDQLSTREFSLRTLAI